MKYYYDFHIHTALSPCADCDMTPNNIINMAILKELHMIAITDHNSCKNAAACMAVAEGSELLVIPGMEVETSEEIHCVALLPNLEKALWLDAFIEERLNKIKNREDIFGQQLIINAEDEIIGRNENLLVTSADIGIFDLVKLVKSNGGAVIPAHVDRSSYSVLSNLGLMPEELDVSYIEISQMTEPESFMASNRRLFPKEYNYLVNSDAHFLGNINERTRYLKFEYKPTAEDIIKLLNGSGI